MAATAALVLTTLFSTLKVSVGMVPLPPKIPAESALYTVLFWTVTVSPGVLAFSAQIPTPQVLSIWLLARTGPTGPQAPEPSKIPVSQTLQEVASPVPSPLIVVI